MDPLKLSLAVVLLLTPLPVHARPAGDRIARWQPYIAEASTRFGVPADWIARVIRAESGGLTTLNGTPIRSKAGAIGLMQLMPATWATMRDIEHLGFDPDDPHDNILAGTAYLRRMADRFGYPGLFAAYNAGPQRYAAWLVGRSRLPNETIAYLGGITGTRPSAPMTVAIVPRQLLFALRHDLGSPADVTPAQPDQDAIFAIRKGFP